MGEWFMRGARCWAALTLPAFMPVTTVQERERRRKAQLLSVILFASACLTLPLLLLNLAIDMPMNVFSLVLFELSLMIPAVCNRRGKLEYASYSYFLSYIVIAGWAYSFDIPTDAAPMLWEWVLLALPPFFTGLFLPYWLPVCFAVLDSVIVVLVVCLQRQHDLVLRALPSYVVPTFLVYVSTLMLAIGVISGLYARSVTQAVVEADRAAELEQANAIIELAHADLADAYARLEDLAAHDPITGLLNHRALDTRITLAAAHALREGQSLAVIFADLDHFKRVNDTWGHKVGDLMLAYLAERLREHVRATDILARYGGEEFVIVLPNMDYVGARQFAERVRATVALMPLTLADGQVVPLTLSLGVALLPDDAATIADVITAADSAMYRAKHSGRNRVCLAIETTISPAA